MEPMHSEGNEGTLDGVELGTVDGDFWKLIVLIIFDSVDLVVGSEFGRSNSTGREIEAAGIALASHVVFGCPHRPWMKMMLWILERATQVRSEYRIILHSWLIPFKLRPVVENGKTMAIYFRRHDVDEFGQFGAILCSLMVLEKTLRLVPLCVFKGKTLVKQGMSRGRFDNTAPRPWS
jgi:hypothetical protein